MAKSERPTCTASNVDGSPCSNKAAEGLTICGTHARAQATGRKNRKKKPAKKPPAKTAGGKNKGGRPVTIDPKKTARMVELLKGGNFITTACQVAGIPYPTYADWMDKADRNAANYQVYRDFREKIESAIAEGEAVRVLQVTKAGSDDWKAAAWWLERHVPERWARVSQRSDEPAAPPAPPADPDDAPSIRALVDKSQE